MGTDKRFRNHISIIIEEIGSILIAFGVFLITVVIQNINEFEDMDVSFFTSKALWLILGVMALAAAVVINRIFVWAKTYIRIEENAVVIEKGSVNKKKNTIGIKNISNINLEQNIFEMLMGTCKVKLDTNSLSTADSTDVQIVLKREDALRFKNQISDKIRAETGKQADMPAEDTERAELLREEDIRYDIVADFPAILRHGFFSVNILSVLILIGGIGASVYAVMQVLEQPELLKSLASAAAAILVAASVIFSALWDTAKDFIRYYDFRAKREADRIHIRYGVLKKVEYTIPVDKIQAIKVRQSLIARIFHRYMVELINVGMGDDAEEKSSFLLLYAKGEVIRERLAMLLPEFSGSAEETAKRSPKTVWAVWSFPLFIYSAALCAVAAVVGMAYSGYAFLIWGGAFALILAGVIFLWLKYITNGAGAGREFLKLCYGWFQRTYIFVRYENIQYIEVSQNFIAKIFRMQKGKIHLLASAGNAEHNIPYYKGDIAEKIKIKMLEGSRGNNR